MTPTINPRIQAIKLSGIRKIANMLVDYPNAINLTVGQPDFPTPAKVKAAAVNAIAANKTGYTHNAGLLELRHAASEYFNNKYGFTYDPQTEVLITAGASGGMDATFRTILEEGDEIIVPAPIFAGYDPLITLTGATAVYLDTTETNFIPDPTQLAALITPKTKAVVFSFPSNPTGVIIPHETMDQLVDVVVKHDIFIVSDEIYSENTFKGTHRSFAQYPQLRSKLFLIHGLSKSHAMTGWRLGFLFASAEWMRHAVKAHAHNTICANAPAQHAAVVALTECPNTPADMNKQYIKRRDLVYTRLTAMGLPTVKPNGAFYIFPSIKEFNMTSEQFAHTLLKEADVAVVPGSAFTPIGEAYVRLSFANSYDQLEIAMDRIEEWIVYWRNNERHIVPDPPLM
ncbi:aminotransferase class I/II-fold pyridoxal phosphate-dependent enzyme [Sporosarcina sp. G11-34]|uniref:aminotransferase class I/II-fold pyridoxal phosphate-dependent enzyme n=1 Tax=Sporosarcina sp. G11-34 TaxID=2849605 RepID=UPI0022A99585|nr:aminotransferase class I/II-fold pyridoxal phosphate-dependent enzyme [Sporosarcina sp. G11-34]MCZ2258666.1 aminotransferase class I/II-fold pyridoxal phosphate-dependent enzyme [Sporosarcina sp. G11-34]